MNELSVKWLNVLGLNFSARNDSSVRQYMFAGHIGQTLVINGANEKIIQTGMEKEFGKYTFRTEMPADGRIIKIIQRYPQTIGSEQISINPETIVIYEDIKTRAIGCFSLTNFTSHHQYFGFQNEPCDGLEQLQVGKIIDKGTVFLDTPAIKKNGGYAYGIELNTVLMSHPAVSEDSILISRDALDKLKFKIYERRTVEFGKNYYPLNIYGGIDNYKIIPDIGEIVRDDGLLCALRAYNDDFDVVEMGIEATMKIDPVFDKLTYVRGPGGRVIDIKIYVNDTELNSVPENMVHQLTKYLVAQKEFYTTLLDTERQLRRDSKRKFGEDKLVVSNEFHRLLIEALIYTDSHQSKTAQPLNRLYRKKPLDDFLIEFIIEYEITPTIGFKLTSTHGGKGVICKIGEPHEMPIDADGNRADIIMDRASTVNRMNPGGVIEQYLGSACRDIVKTIKNRMYDATDYTKMDMSSLIEYVTANHYHHFQEHIGTILKFYKIVSLKQYELYSSLPEPDQLEHFCYVLKNGIYLFFPPDNQVDTTEMILEIEKSFDLTYGPISYIGYSGKPCVTKRSIRIGPMYFLLLEKIGDDWSSLSSGKLQHFGILSPVIKSEKYSYPWRNTGVRTIGETEGRLYVSYCGPKALAEMMDRSNSPMTHRNVVYNILSADSPGNIEYAVDRNLIPLGNTKPLQLMNHIFFCNGFRYTWEPEDNS